MNESLRETVLRIGATPLLVAACSGAGSEPESSSPATGNGPVDVEGLGWSPEGLAAVRRLATERGSAALMVVTGGEVVLSHGDVARNFRAHSIRKSFLSALYGIAVDGGSIDLTRTLSELGVEERTPLSGAEQQATVADLLTSRSGVYLPAASEEESMRESRPERHRHAPGTRWYYNNWDFNVLGSIYRQETGEDVFESFQRRIAAPTGMQDFDLEAMRYQYEEVSLHPSYKFRISTRDLARFGVLYLNHGAWEGRQIVPRAWVEASTRAVSITGRSGTKSGYGMLWWVVATPQGAPAWPVEAGAFTASGTGGQRLTVIPGIETVVVHRMDTDDRDGARLGSSAYDRMLASLMEARLGPGATR